MYIPRNEHRTTEVIFHSSTPFLTPDPTTTTTMSRSPRLPLSRKKKLPHPSEPQRIRPSLASISIWEHRRDDDASHSSIHLSDANTISALSRSLSAPTPTPTEIFLHHLPRVHTYIGNFSPAVSSAGMFPCKPLPASLNILASPNFSAPSLLESFHLFRYPTLTLTPAQMHSPTTSPTPPMRTPPAPSTVCEHAI